MPWPEYITAAKDVVLAVAGAATAWVAIKGLSRWSDELLGKADFEAARLVARSIYALREQVVACRNPFMMAFEFPDQQKTKFHRTAQEEAEGYAHVWNARWKGVIEGWSAFEAAALEAEALWGKPIREATNEVGRSLSKLRAAHDSYVSNLRSEGRHFTDAPDFGRDVNETVYARPDGDSFHEALEAKISTIDQLLMPHLRRGRHAEPQQRWAFLRNLKQKLCK